QACRPDHAGRPEDEDPAPHREPKAMRALVAALALALMTAVLGAGPSHAVEPDEIMDDPALEGRAREISKSLRCLVCQNQSIDDSNADLARDLRLLVRQRL